MTVKVSIITMTYNNLDSLPQAIESINKQKVSNDYQIEYIVADDGSKNIDKAYIEELLGNVKFQSKLIVNKLNLGTVRNFNKAINESQGQIVIPLSSDDEFYDEYVIKDIIEEFDRTNRLIITGLMVPIQNGKELQSMPFIRDRKFFKNKEALLKKMLLGRNLISGASTYYHREIFERIGVFNEDYLLLEDYPFYIKALVNNYNIHLFERKTIKYGTNGVSWNPQSTSNIALRKDLIKNCNEMLSLNLLKYWQRRYLVYFQMYDSSQKLRIINIIKFPEQFILWILKSIIYRVNILNR